MYLSLTITNHTWVRTLINTIETIFTQLYFDLSYNLYLISGLTKQKDKQMNLNSVKGVYPYTVAQSVHYYSEIICNEQQRIP